VPGSLTGPTVFGLFHDRATRLRTKIFFTCVVVTYRLATDRTQRGMQASSPRGASTTRPHEPRMRAGRSPSRKAAGNRSEPESPETRDKPTTATWRASSANEAVAAVDTTRMWSCTIAWMPAEAVMLQLRTRMSYGIGTRGQVHWRNQPTSSRSSFVVERTESWNSKSGRKLARASRDMVSDTALSAEATVATSRTGRVSYLDGF
jgi:hypothetical protein